MQAVESRNIKRCFRFKQFSMTDARCGMKIGTDAVLLGAWSGAGLHPAYVADIGAGCGIVGLMLAQRFTDTAVQFIEIDNNALQDLKQNINSSPWAGRCQVVPGDFRQWDGRDIDLMVSNPPFFATGQLAPDQSRALARHASSLSPAALVELASERLSPTGRLAMIFPFEQLAEIEAAAALARLNTARVCTVSTRNDMAPVRVLLELTRAGCSRDTSHLVIRNSDNTFTDQYSNLTRDFHIGL